MYNQVQEVNSKNTEKMQKAHRVRREIARLMVKPPEGVSCYAKEDSTEYILVTIIGPAGCAYEAGVFELDVELPERYPFEPPHVKFRTPIYHPNIDNNGRICLDLLRMPPKGGWKPTISLENLLTAIRSLLVHPNINDPLMTEIADEYRYNRFEFEYKARNFQGESKRKRDINSINVY